MGFLVLPGSLVGAAINLRTLMDWQPPAGLQVALLRFIVDGLLDRHLRRTRKIYSERHRRVARFVHNAAAARHLIEGVPSCAGLHVTALLPEGVSGRPPSEMMPRAAASPSAILPAAGSRRTTLTGS